VKDDRSAFGGVRTALKRQVLRYAPRLLLRAYTHFQLRFEPYRSGDTKKDWFRFRRLAKIGRDGDPVRYGKLLQRVDPGLSLPHLADARFVGSGLGVWNLTNFRTGVVDGEWVFEKIYLLNSLSWRKLLWAHRDVLPNLGTKPETPPLLWQIHGNWLAAAYFPFLPDTRPLPTSRTLSAALSFQEAVAEFRWTGTDPDICDFRRDPIYQAHRKRLCGVLARAGEDPKHLELAERYFLQPDMPRRFTHGDLTPGNVLFDGTILDLDLCGYYPVGYEYGKALADGSGFASPEEVQTFLERKLDLPTRKEQAAVYYFAATFYCAARGASRAVSDGFILSLWKRATDFIGQPPSGTSS
jgi:hypothetical protein